MSTSGPNALANIIRILPTGTVFFFQFVNPLVTNNGNCNLGNKILTGLVLGGCFISSVFACFTDRYKYKGPDGEPRYAYGIITRTGIRPICSDDSPPPDAEQKNYQFRCPGDVIHLITTVTAFCALALLDAKTVKCYCPSFDSTAQKVLPAIAGSLSGWVASCEINRHGIGYHPTTLNHCTPKNEDTTKGASNNV